jgi:hypothetical protein
MFSFLYSDMNPFKDIRKWERKNFPDINPEWIRRKIAEEETDRDFQKSIQQLLSDVHEESLAEIPQDATNDVKILFQLQRLIGAQKRMVSLQTVSTFQAERTSILMFWLTLIIAIQTGFLIWFTVSPRQTSAPSPTISHETSTNSANQK